MTQGDRRDLTATFVCFGLSGVISGTWFSRIPAVRDQLSADLQTVGLVLVCLGLGSFASMPFGGRLSRRFSSRRVCLVAGIAAPALFSVLPLLTSPVAFGAVLVLAGAAIGLFEVMLNVHGADVERAVGRSVMPALHGLWSGGLLLGSALGAGLAALGIGLGQHFWLLLPIVAVANTIGTLFWHDHRAPAREGGRVRPSAKALTLPVILLAVMLLCSNIGEGSASDWLALYAHDERGFGEGAAAAVFTVYSLMITIGRLAGGFVLDRLGRVITVRLCGVITAAGIAVVLFLPLPAGPYLGAALWGLGLSVVFPAAITAAGEHGRDNSAGAIAAVSTLGFGAFLTGPPLIGLLAQRTSIGLALGIVLVLSFGITVLAPLMRPARPTDRSE
ncbi:MFS transporter [Microlunatus speluncae]|uniref:MFS transporter n=1 Tax=Microlunatus speluncae TaxID=2594267 RepID=UPI00137558A2|nr:MFS transporter [Microlunatus speluncae]